MEGRPGYNYSYINVFSEKNFYSHESRCSFRDTKAAVFENGQQENLIIESTRTNGCNRGMDIPIKLLVPIKCRCHCCISDIKRINF